MTSSGLAPDVAVAVELIERIKLETWGHRSAGLTHATPYLRADDDEFFEELQAWLASRAGDRPSFVQAAVANLRRVLNDLLLVIHYDLDPRGEVLWVRKWYHGALGGTSSPREVEFFQCHTLLIHNLACELTRAINLVVLRAREADSRVLQASPLALVDTGSHQAPMHAAQYTAAEQDLPQPYPGLRGFPSVITSRDVGALGEVRDGEPRKPADVEAWIDELLKRTGGKPSEPPGPEIPPRALPRPKPAAGTADDSREQGLLSHPLLLTVYAVLVVISVIGGATAKPWLVGASAGAVLVAALTYRQLRPPPSPWALALVGGAAIAGGFLGNTISDGSSSDSGKHGSTSHTATAPLTKPPVHGSSGPVLNPAAACASVHGASYRGGRGETQFVSSPGQLLTGGGRVVGRVVPGGGYAEVVRVTSGDRVELSVRLTDGAYASVRNVSLKARLAAYGNACWRVTVRSHSPTDPGGNVTLGPALVAWRQNRPTTLKYIRGSTELFDRQGKVLAHLPDGVVTRGVALPYAIPPGADGPYFVNFAVRVL